MRKNKLFSAAKRFPEYANRKEAEVYAIPEEHQRLVMERFDKARKDPGILIDWDEAIKRLKYK